MLYRTILPIIPYQPGPSYKQSHELRHSGIKAFLEDFCNFEIQDRDFEFESYIDFLDFCLPMKVVLGCSNNNNVPVFQIFYEFAIKQSSDNKLREERQV